MLLRLQIVSELGVVGSYVLEGSGCEQVLTQLAIRVITKRQNCRKPCSRVVQEEEINVQ